MKQVRLALATFVALLSLQQGLVAQNKHHQKGEHQRPNKEQIREKKQAYLEKALELTSEESKQLMPILAELDEQRFKLWSSLREQRQAHKRGEALSEAESEGLLELVLESRVKEAELERSYYRKCKGIISHSKLLKLQQLNREFAKNFLHGRKKHQRTKQTD